MKFLFDFKFKLFLVVPFLVLLLGCLSAAAQQEQEENLFTDIISCKKTDNASIGKLITELEKMLISGYGEIAADSIHAYIQKAKKLQRADHFMTHAKVIEYHRDTTSYKTWLVNVFKGAKTPADSIEQLCSWIPLHFALGEPYLEMTVPSIDSLYYKIRDGLLYGEDMEYSIFLCRLAEQYKSVWKWGTPLLMSGEPSDKIREAGKQPKHNWVGFVSDSGSIWCLADPSIGGVVRDKNSGSALPLDSVILWLNQKDKASRVYVQPVKESLQAIGPCVFSLDLRNNETPVAYTPFGTKQVITRGEWFTFFEAGSMRASLVTPYWKAEKFPHNTVYNIYLKFNHGLLYDTDASLVEKMAKKYNASIDLK